MTSHISFAGIFAALFLTASALAQQPATSPRQFPPGSVTRFDQLPPCRLRTEIGQLPPAAQERASQWLRSFHFTEGDLPSLHVDSSGGLFYICEQIAEPAAAQSEPTPSEAAVAVSPFPAGLVFHSRPGAPNILYLNFTGETVTNTEWNNYVGRSSIPAVVFSTDGDYSTFSDAEQTTIKRMWQRIAEDYAPFNIDVTTERPATFNNRTVNALVTRNTDATGAPNPASTAGGVAYVNVFNTSTYANYRPAWIYIQGHESYMAEAASHEVGHNMGLSHDATASSSYYGGHGSGDTSWGPIMGTGYDRNVSQWCKGEYYQANNTEDDLAILAGKITYRTDDFGGTAASATTLVLTGTTNIVSTTPDTDPANTNTANKGVIERNTDVDVFSFITGNGTVKLSVNPWIVPSSLTRGGNLDLRIELYNEAGALLFTNNPASLTTALIQTNLAEGRYYLHIKNTGVGTPLVNPPSGFTSYGSIGQYFISGFVTASTGFVAPPVATLQVTDITTSGQGNKQFTVTYSDDVGVSVATIGSSDVRVTGTNGYNQLAQFVSLNTGGDGTPRIATYQVPPPAGATWGFADNGTYTITMLTNQVGDIEGAFVAPGQLGQFVVSVPVSYYSATMNTNPGWTLDPAWAYGVPNDSPGPTSAFTGTNIVGYNLSGNYTANLSAKYATTPAINTAGSTSLTLQFRRWLGLHNTDSAFLQVSTNGVNWLSLWTSSGAVSDGSWQAVQYSLPASVVGSASLRLRWGLSSSPGAHDFGWNIDDVELIGSGTLDTTPPTAFLSVANVTSEGSPSHSCSVTYTDGTGVRLLSLDSADVLVTGPNGYSNLVEFTGADLPLDGSPMTASYSIPAPGGAWDVTDNGTYVVTLLAGTVEDTLNNATALTALGSFSSAIPTNTPGSLVVMPGAGLNSTGYVGGVFAPASLIYTLTNSGGSPLNWTASAAQSWVGLSASNGALAIGASDTLTVSINTNANLLAAGDYSDIVSFINNTTGNGNTTRPVNLTVLPVPTFQLTLSANNPAWGGVTPTNGLYPAGSIIELLATPAAYYQFIAWTGDISGATNPVQITLNTNVTATAVFSEILTTNFPTPHWWLAANGISNNFESAVTDTGANGFQLWQSYIAGLEPTNPASQLLLSGSPANNGGDFILNWNTVTGRVYSLSTSSNLPGFTPLPGATNLAWTIQSFTNSLAPDATQNFYRLEVRKP